MSTITTINGSDTISSSRTDINTNFSNLNTDKIESNTTNTLTNKTIDGASNTLSNINADSIIDGITNKVLTAIDKTNLDANTLKVSAGDSINTHSDVDTVSVAPVSGDNLQFDGTNFVPTAGAVSIAGCIVTMAGSQGFGAGSLAKVNYDTIISDDNGEFDTTTKTFTVTDTGRYLVNYSMYLSGNSNNSHYHFYVYVNGVSAAYSTRKYSSFFEYVAGESITNVLELTAGDTVNIYFYNESGTGVTKTINGGVGTRLSILRIK